MNPRILEEMAKSAFESFTHSIKKDDRLLYVQLSAAKYSRYYETAADWDRQPDHLKRAWHKVVSVALTAQWILPDEELPDDEMAVLVTCSDSDEAEKAFRSAGEWRSAERHQEDGLGVLLPNVIAWTELPDPPDIRGIIDPQEAE